MKDKAKLRERLIVAGVAIEHFEVIENTPREAVTQGERCPLYTVRYRSMTCPSPKPPPLAGRTSVLLSQAKTRETDRRQGCHAIGLGMERHRGHCSDEGGDLGVDRRTANRGRPERVVQCSRNRRRCHRRTVSGVTIRRGCLHPAQTLASQTQRRRSVVRSLGRVAVLLYTASW